MTIPDNPISPASEVPHIDITIPVESENLLLNAAMDVVLSVRKQWRKEQLQFKFFTDGITNKLVGFWNDSKEDTLLIRIYGEGTDRIIDRKVEVQNMLKLQSIGMGAKLYATFTNGLCYEFIHGELLNQTSMLDPVVYREVAKTMARVHSLLPPDNTKSPCLWSRLEKFLNICNPSFSPRLSSEYPSKSELRTSISELKAELETLGCPVVFCHNDALLANIVVTPGGGVTFIDMEYGAANYAAFDIANHFCEFVGCEGKLDFERFFPSKEFQQAWLAEYLDSKDEPLIERWLTWVSKFVLASHLMWSIWAVIQAESSTIPFDFQDYAIQRWQEFLRARKINQLDS